VRSSTGAISKRISKKFSFGLGANGVRSMRPYSAKPLDTSFPEGGVSEVPE
jgi:hypothetical protein